MKNYISEVIVQVATSKSCGFGGKWASLIFFHILNFPLPVI
jgi:3-oxoacyl-(acyl-carrier-protein) synthase